MPNAPGRRPLLLFVCQGNICRSPMLAAVADYALRQARINVEVASAGTSALIGDPAEPSAVACVAEIGLELKDHRARQVTPQMAEAALLIVAATAAQRDWVRGLAPEHREHITSFDDITGLGDLPDPWGRNSGEYRRVREVIESGMPAVVSAARSRLDFAKGANRR